LILITSILLTLSLIYSDHIFITVRHVPLAPITQKPLSIYCYNFADIS